MRLQKYLSAAGLCSRREAEKWIEAGRVRVNGVVASLGDSAEPGTDSVCVDGRPVGLPTEHTYIMLHKPRGYVTTLSDERGRRTVAELVTDARVRLYPVGRLDFESEGLLIMTDDGEVANRLMHPRHGVDKTYHVRVKGSKLDEAAEMMRHPMRDDKDSFLGAKVEILRRAVDGGELAMTIAEGKNRQIRRMCALAGLHVSKLCRVRQGDLYLGDLPCGKWRHLRVDEVEFLHHIL
ncbi:MAG: rRNA pseudouridine synthase [Ruminococcaceae bacterium]|nr:rRNA pseudouridine synthase [Oscillospiraceae bacterium]